MKFIETANAVRPLGPYSQGIAANGFVFVSGTVGIDPKSNEMVKGGIQEQTKQVMENIKAVLEAGGSAIEKIVKVSVFIKDGTHFKDMNATYSTFLGTHRPIRTTVVTGFARDDVLVEIDVVAVQ
jgi:2-iminobutanoate/2-iminopropanoate deaminase